MYDKTDGFIANFRFLPNGKKSQKLFKQNELISKNTYDNLPEVYTSMNSFRTSKSRQIENIKHLNSLYSDIDCYKLGLTPEQVIFALKMDYYDRIIPCPTFIIKSGRGLYLLWKLDGDYDRQYLPEWKRAQEYLYDKLSVFGADRAAMDAARILRVPGSIHSTTGNKVEIADFDDVQYTLESILEEYGADAFGTDISKFFVNEQNNERKNKQEFKKKQNVDADKSKSFANKDKINKKQRWGKATPRQIECATEIGQEQDLTLPNFANFEETFEWIGRYAQRRFRSDKSATENQRKYATKIAEEKGLELPDFNDFTATGDFISRNCNKKPYEGNTFLDYWLRDIEKLITVLRKGEDCRRELCLFLNRLWLCETTHDYELALRKTLELNAKLDKPFSDSYVRSHTRSAEDIIKRGNTYRYTKKNIIEMLSITDDEMKNLKYLNKLTKKERESTRKREAYEKHLEKAEKKPKKEMIRERREKMADMLNTCKTEKEICEALKISRRTYYGDRTVIIAQGLVKCAAKKIIEVRKSANKITDSITSVIREAWENIKEIANIHKKSSDSNNDMLKQIKKVQIKC